MCDEEKIAREIVRKANEHAMQPDNPEGPDTNTYLMDMIVRALKGQPID
jgi:hypothetical protein